MTGGFVEAVQARWWAALWLKKATPAEIAAMRELLADGEGGAPASVDRPS